MAQYSTPSVLYSIVTTTVTAFYPSSATDGYTAQSILNAFVTGTPQTLPTSLPHVIAPPRGIPQQPQNATMVQVGFLYALNYPFVVANSLAQEQLFGYLPSGIAYVIIVPEEKITMQSLRAYESTGELHYLTTLAFMYIPSSSVDLLQVAINSNSTPMYNNPDATIKTLMNFINPDYPVEAGAVLGSKSSATASATAITSAPGPSLTSRLPSSSLSSGPKISIAVAVPVIFIALLLLGLLFWRRREASRHNNDEPPTGENETNNQHKRFEMPADERMFELHVREYDLELPAETRKELQGDSRRRQELNGAECSQELDAREDRSEP